MKLWPLYVVLLLSLLVVPALAADTYMGFVASTTMDSAMQFDPSSNTITTSWSTGTNPRCIYVNPSGTYVYVANYNDGTVTVYTSNDKTSLYTISVGTSAFGISSNPNGDKLYVSDDVRSIYVIDAATRAVSKTITLAPGTMPRYMYCSDDTLYVTCTGTNQVAMINIATDTLTGYINVGSTPYFMAGNAITDKLLVCNWDSNTVSIIDMSTNTVSATVGVGTNPAGVTILNTGAKAYVANFGNNNVSVIDLSTNTVSASVSVGASPVGIGLEPNNQRAYVTNTNSNNISIIDTSTNTVSGSINSTYSNPEYLAIYKIAPESASLAPMQVTFTVTSGVLLVTDANVSVYDATTGLFISSDNTDDAGNTIFVVIPGKRYLVNVTGSDIISSSQSVQVQPTKDQYTIRVQTNGFNWNPFDWYNTNGTSINGSRDSTKSITGAFAYSIIGTTGYMEAQYNDSTGQTINIVFDLHKYNLTSEQYELVNTASIAANSGSHNFTILNAVNGTYRIYANGTNYLFSQGNITRMGEHYFRPAYGYDMGWPAYLYNFFDILILVIIGLTSVKRHAIAGAVFMLFMSWVFVLIGWTSNLGISALIIPVMLSVFTIIIFLYAAAKWRRETGV